jgi:hypothetical protein
VKAREERTGRASLFIVLGCVDALLIRDRDRGREKREGRELVTTSP